MNLVDALILGIIQGLTEFLPISSSAHVQIAQQLLGLGQFSKPQLTAFIATIQLGTELAVVIFFRKDILRISTAFIKSFGGLRDRAQSSKLADTNSQDIKLGWLVMVGTLPVVIIGLVFQDLIENNLRNLWVIAFTLIFFGLLLGLADRLGKRQRSIEQLTTQHGLLFGLGQALAVIPGVSRSGGTITVGLMLGYSRQAAARFSFLLAIPAVLASGIYQFAKTFSDLDSSTLGATILATVVSFAIGYSVIIVLLRYLERGSFLPFVVWRVFVGVAILILLSTNQLVA